MEDKILDTSGLNCPLPILKTKKELAIMKSGEVLKIIATDSGLVKDIEAFCKQTGDKLLSSGEDNLKFIFTVEKA